MAGPVTRALNGQYTGWLGHVRTRVAITPSNATIYDPPLRLLYALGAGDVTLILDGDDEDNNVVPTPPTASGTNPPAVTVAGTTLRATSAFWIDVTLGGTVGNATFQFSVDGGSNYNGVDILTAATVVLTGLGVGLTITFPAGTYNADNFYKATPTNVAALVRTLAAKAELPANYAIRQVRATGTTATGIEGFR